LADTFGEHGYRLIKPTDLEETVARIDHDPG
jgi:hypothetical protein